MNLKSVFIGAFTLGALILGGCKPSADSNHLVILHTNDTHSAIEPNSKDLGGIARRKVLVDSVRDVRENVLLVDAGDAVQGSLYYTLFGGEVERVLMNALGYDIQILGNHEFDKGMDKLAKEWKQLNAVRLSTNYDMTGSTLDGLFVPSLIKEFDGKKVGFLGINLNPAGMIVEENYKGIKYVDAIEAANAEAAKLKNEGADIVIAVTHIGYDNDNDYSDLTLAAASKDIDLIIGGHSHTVVDPKNKDAKWRVANAVGDTVSVLQTGSSGVNLGEIDINLDTKEVSAKLIPVNSRLDSNVKPEIEALIAPYRQAVDSMRSKKIGVSPYEFDRKSPEMLNLLSDFVRMRGTELAKRPVDIAIMNKGGIRNNLPKGDITQGGIIDIAPFDNSVVVMEIKGKDLLDNFEIMAAQDGQGVSSNVKAVYDPNNFALNTATIDGKEINPNATYILATIDYLAAGNDYMTPLKNGKIIAVSPDILYKSLIDYISTGKLDSIMAAPDTNRRMSSF